MYAPSAQVLGGCDSLLLWTKFLVYKSFVIYNRCSSKFSVQFKSRKTSKNMTLLGNLISYPCQV